MTDLLTLEELKRHKDADYDARQHTLARRDNLYWNFRYQNGSYKARKSGLQPILMMAKRGGDKIRVYGDAGEIIEPKKMQFVSSRFKAWRQKEQALKRLAKKKDLTKTRT